MTDFDPWGKGNNPEDTEEPALRRTVLTPASAIKPRRVRWLWEGRIAHGTLSLLAGREGLGKSTLAYHLAAQVSRGLLEGEDYGQPRDVLIAATEDSWEHTIVPRLIAARADLDRVYRIEVITYDNMRLSLSLPRDFADVDEAVQRLDVGLMVLDPLMSVIDAKLDTHRDRELRQALEPLATLADRTRMAIVGLIHHNKSGSTDALQLVMGSKAFTAVARSVHTCIPDPDDETQERRLFATSKNNLGRIDLPVLGFTISSHAVETEDDGTAWTGRLNWTGEVAGNMAEIMTRSADPERSATAEAADWLTDYLTSVGGEAAKTDVEKAARAAGHATRTLTRVRDRLGIQYSSAGFPRRTFWALPGATERPGGNPSEPLHEPPERDIYSQANGAVSSSQAKVLGPTARPGENGASISQAALSDTPQSGQVRPTMAPLGPTGADQGKRDEPSRARTQGESQLGLTVNVAPLETQSGQAAKSPHVHARRREADTNQETHHDQPRQPQPSVRPTTGGDSQDRTQGDPKQHLPRPDEPTTHVGHQGDRQDHQRNHRELAPICIDCGWAIDSNGHHIHCEVS